MSCSLESCSPSSWLWSPLPVMQGPNDPVRGDWARVHPIKHYFNGGEKEKSYVMEVSTQDLYPGQDEPWVISGKAIAVIVGIIPYCLAIMVANLIKVVLDFSSIVWKGVPQLVSDFSSKGCVAAVGNFFARAICIVPLEIGEGLFRIVRSPFYAVAMMCATVYEIVRPLEGRVWISELETRWHQGATYKDDARLLWPENTGSHWVEWASALASGKVYFLAFCMLKRGNLNDQRNGVNIYTWKEPLEVTETSSNGMETE